MNRAAVVAAFLLLSVAGAAAQPAEPKQLAPESASGARRLTLEEAIELATESNIEVEVGKEAIASAESRVRATKTYRLPSLGVRASVLLWNDEIAFAVAPGAPPVVVREQVTGSAEVNVVQPITTAIVLGTLIDLERAGVTAARAELDATRLEVAYQVAEVYLSGLQMGTLRAIAATTVTQIEANIVRAQALETAGILSDLDIYRLEASRDQARQQVLEAEVGAESARRALSLLVGTADGTELELVDLDTTPPELGWTEDEAVAAARKHRPEARVAGARARQARLGIKVARAQYLPSVTAIANFTHNINAGSLGSADSAYVGVSLEWNLWDWGKRKEDIAQARSASRQAKLYDDFVDDQLGFEVRSAWLAASTARKTIEVTASGLKAAKEAYRLQQVLFEQGAATTTDVLDAQSELARALSGETIARHQYLIAWMALGRAVGETPSPRP